MRILVTGGCGFIGANFLLKKVQQFSDSQFLNLDALTYAGNPLSLRDIESAPNYQFAHVDLADYESVRQIVSEFKPDVIVHFAAETHVDRSLKSPLSFLRSNVDGTTHLLEAARECWDGNYAGKVFMHVSTDEVYGELGHTGKFHEELPYRPSSPYSASKAASDHMVNAWFKSFGLPTKITNCSNNYGPLQFPEKLIPLMIRNASTGKPLPVYGDGSNVRDWLYVGDHVEAIWQVMEKGKLGETYCIGGESERTNLDVVKAICRSVSELMNQPMESLERLITFVTDRPGHDFRYAIDTSKIKSELGWQPTVTFEEGLHQTVKWYLENPGWIDSVTSGEYLRWVEEHYGATEHA